MMPLSFSFFSYYIYRQLERSKYEMFSEQAGLPTFNFILDNLGNVQHDAV